MGVFLLVLAPVCHATCDGGAECGIRSSRLRFGFEVEFISNALRPTVENVLALNGLTDDHWRHKVLESRQNFNLTIEACSGTDRLVCTRPEIVTDPVTVAGAQGLLESIDAWTRTGYHGTMVRLQKKRIDAHDGKWRVDEPRTELYREPRGSSSRRPRLPARRGHPRPGRCGHSRTRSG